MPRLSSKNLEWVRRNRQPRRRLMTVGQLAAGVLEGRSLTTARRLGRLKTVIEAHTDADFARHCSLGELRAGTLTILVDDPSCAAAMRDRWLLPLSRLLKKPGNAPHVSSVRFATGQSNLVLGGPDCAREGASGAARTMDA